MLQLNARNKSAAVECFMRTELFLEGYYALSFPIKKMVVTLSVFVIVYVYMDSSMLSGTFAD